MGWRKAFLVAVLAFPAAIPCQAQSYGFATYDAIVSAAGVAGTGSGVASAAKTATGDYTITFRRPLTTCVAAATIVAGTPGFITWARVATDPTLIRVRTFDKSGAAKNFGFSIIVTCGP